MTRWTLRDWITNGFALLTMAVVFYGMFLETQG